MNFDADIDLVFFGEFAEEVQIEGASQRAIFDQDLEIVDDQGSVTLVEYAVTVKRGVLSRGVEFPYLDKSWVVGQLLERGVDGKFETWEIASV